MRLSEDIDFTTLTWVKGELDETLKQARHALEAYVEDPQDSSQMRFCATYLHQVHGTLRMVELYGAAMVTEEMERLATSLLEGEVAERDEAYTVLMRGIVQLPDYLERLQSGHKDIPIVLLPLLNELRAARGEKSLSESALFTPDLGRALPVSANGPEQPMPDLEVRQFAERQRSQFQIALLNWFKGEDVDANIARISDVCDQLVAHTNQEEARRLFWVAAGVMEALRAKAFDPSPQLKQTIGKVEREIKRLADAGETSFRVDPPRELTRSLLYFVAHAPTEHGRIGELREVFRLNALLPSEEELAHAQGVLSGHNRALLDTVSVAIKDDLLRVKDALDLHLRNSDADIKTLEPQVEVLDRVGDTLGMLGLGVARRVVQDQHDAISDMLNGSREASESALLDVAGALLYVEASLDDQVQGMGTGAGGAADSDRPLPKAEGQKVLDAVVKEAQANFAQVKQCFVAFVESNWDHAQLADVPRLLEEVSGAFRILELDEPPQYLTAIRRFTEIELLGRRRVPNGQQMDTLADVLASLEYFIEALREHRPKRDTVLQTTRDSLEALGYWPIPDLPTDLQASPTEPDMPAAMEPVVEPATPESASDAAAPTPVPTPASPAEAAPADAPASAPAAAAPAVGHGGFEGAADDIDDEIREVFIEEVEEEIGNLQELLPAWKAQPDNLDLLKPIRRVFHTLKGSGRLVGALTLGEFSWKIENMLNRVLDQSIQPGEPVQALIDHACNVLPEMLSALRGEVGVSTDLEAIKDVAERLSNGEEAWYTPAPPAAAPVEPVVEAEVDAVEEIPVEESDAETEATAPEAAEGEDEMLSRFGIDPLLFDILKTEVAGHLDGVESFLERCQPAPVAADDALLRSVHTMNGAFAMTEVPGITDVVSPLEGYIKRLLAQGAAPTAVGLDLMRESVSAVREVMGRLESTSDSLPDLGDLSARLAAERDTLPEPKGPSIPVHLDDEEAFLDGEATEDDSIPQPVDFRALTEDATPEETPDVVPKTDEGEDTADLPEPVTLEAPDTSELPDLEVADEAEAAPADERIPISGETLTPVEASITEVSFATDPEASPDPDAHPESTEDMLESEVLSIDELVEAGESMEDAGDLELVESIIEDTGSASEPLSDAEPVDAPESPESRTEDALAELISAYDGEPETDSADPSGLGEATEVAEREAAEAAER
ncbi:MAG: Hpt domain-containing protein, partial [Xanthomonadales bacterium]|nr:Hpt domain-containing protein [Xanthomonadales bacterium]